MNNKQRGGKKNLGDVVTAENGWEGYFEDATIHRLMEASSQIVFRFYFQPESAVYLSTPSTALLGYSPQDYYKDPALFFSQVYPKDRAAFEALCRNPETSSKTSMPVRFIRADGNLISFEVMVLPLHNSAGQSCGVEGILKDVTRNRLIAEQQQDLVSSTEIERQWVTAVLTNSPIAKLYIKRPGVREKFEVNERFRSLVPHLDTSALTSEDLSQLLFYSSGKRVPVKHSPFSRAIQGSNVSEEEYFIKTETSKIPVRVSSTGIKDSQGQISGAVVSIEDLTSVKKLERLQREWGSIIAHDLRQPINTIQLFGEYLERHPDFPLEYPDRFRKGVKWINSSARQLKRLVDDLANFSQLEANNLKLEKQQVDLGVLIRDVADTFQAEHTESSIKVSCSHLLPNIHADPVRLQQIFTNLVSNGIKYGRSGTPVLIHCAQEGSNIRVSVINQGEGLTTEEIAGLFCRFGRTEKAVKSGKQGTGLGLYITKGLVEAHGGRIWAESIPDETTSFHILLPVE